MYGRLVSNYTYSESHRCYLELVSDDQALGRPSSAPMKADSCDLLSKSAGVDPLLYVADTHKETLSSPSALVAGLAPGTVVTGRANKGDRCEYARLVGRQLTSGKVGVFDEAFASETVFALGKSNGHLQEV